MTFVKHIGDISLPKLRRAETVFSLTGYILRHLLIASSNGFFVDVEILKKLIDTKVNLEKIQCLSLNQL